MLNKIKEMLASGEEVRLECIDKESYLDLEISWRDSRQIILDSSLIVTGLYGIDKNNLELKGISRIIPIHHLKYFRIVEAKPTFDDLIDVAVKAWKDGRLKVLEFESGAVEQIFTVIGEDAYRWHEGDSDYNHAVGLINSLYTEIFVIESMEGIDNIKWDTAKAVLTNDCELDLSILDGAVNRNIMLRLLKGATVTQKRGA